MARKMQIFGRFLLISLSLEYLLSNSLTASTKRAQRKIPFPLACKKKGKFDEVKLMVSEHKECMKW